MKLSLLITHAIAIGAGILGTLVFVTTFSIPEVTSYVVADPTRIQLVNSEKPQPYSLLLQQKLLARTYIDHPLYFHKRQEGYNILEKLANQGHASTAGLLSDLYMFRVYDGEPRYFKKSYDWAIKAAELGEPSPLIGKLLTSDNDYRAKLLDVGVNLDQGLVLLENMAKTHHTNYIAKNLYSFYKEQGNTTKAEYWNKITIDMYDNPKPEPVCQTLSADKL